MRCDCYINDGKEYFLSIDRAVSVQWLAKTMGCRCYRVLRCQENNRLISDDFQINRLTNGQMERKKTTDNSPFHYLLEPGECVASRMMRRLRVVGPKSQHLKRNLVWSFIYFLFSFLFSLFFFLLLFIIDLVQSALSSSWPALSSSAS